VSSSFSISKDKVVRKTLLMIAGTLLSACATVAEQPLFYRHDAPPFQLSFDREGVLQPDSSAGHSSATLTHRERVQRVANQIDLATRDGTGRKPLVMLIHGTNPGIPAYPEMEDTIRARYFPDGKVVFAEVFWPGGAFLRDVHPWGYAQHNSYGAGLGVRQVLSALPDDIPVRIITHSMGGGVAAGALWNVVSKIQQPKWYKRNGWLREWRDEYIARLDSFPTPTLKDIRVGMLVPAMPGCTFDDFARPAPSVNPENYRVGSGSGLGCGFGENAMTDSVRRPNIRRIVVGANENDFVIQAVIRQCSAVGVRCLGSRESDFTDYVEPINKLGTEVRRSLITTREAPREARGLALEAHYFKTYVTSPVNKEFFDLLFL
jgi:hypothetical protein